MKKRKPYSEQKFRAALAALRKQAHLLDKLTDVMIEQPSTLISRAVGPLVVATLASCRSVLLLTSHDHIRDAFVTARTTLLNIVNACYILSEGESAADRAHKHAIQKAIRDLDREMKMDDFTLTLKWSGVDELKRNPRFDAALREFTRKNKTERRHWAIHDLKEQLAIIDRKYGHRLAGFLLFGMLCIYRHASELAHGTLFGMIWHLGFTSPGEQPETREEINLGPRNRAALMASVLCFCIHSLVEILAREFPSLSPFPKRSDAILRQLIGVFGAEEGKR